MTAHDLLQALTANGLTPTVEGTDLVFDGDLPAHLIPLVEVLQSGIRAILTGRRWYGLDDKGKAVGDLKPYKSLDPRQLLPDAAKLLTVEGDATWDRVAWHWSKEAPTAVLFFSTASKAGAA